MCSSRSAWRSALMMLMALLLLPLAALQASAETAAPAQAREFTGIGRPATAAELAAWDIDVRPDFKGLPKGSGSVEKGMAVWEAKCAMCHGVFGESNEVFAPIVGGTTADDIKTGRAARLRDPAFPGRTTLMKLSSLATLWDYINRAMPWNAPKSLSADEVYAVTAYILNLGHVVPDDFVLSDRNMAEAQARLPNRNGMSTRHALWPGRTLGGSTTPDVKAIACMKDCPVEATVASMLPEHARNAHGNLAEQNRPVGAQRGAQTTAPATAKPAAAVATTAAANPPPAAGTATKPAAKPPAMPTALLGKHACSACHSPDAKLVGPSWKEIAGRHGSRADAEAYLVGRMKAGSTGVWGPIPMPPQALPPDDAATIARWLAAGAGK